MDDDDICYESKRPWLEKIGLGTPKPLSLIFIAQCLILEKNRNLNPYRMPGLQTRLRWTLDSSRLLHVVRDLSLEFDSIRETVIKLLKLANS